MLAYWALFIISHYLNSSFSRGYLVSFFRFQVPHFLGEILINFSQIIIKYMSREHDIFIDIPVTTMYIWIKIIDLGHYYDNTFIAMLYIYSGFWQKKYKTLKQKLTL